MYERALTVRQPYASLIMAGLKGVENRSWPVPSTLPQWGDCPTHGRVILDYPTDGHIADDGPGTTTGLGHASGCGGDCDRHGCPVPVPVQVDPRYPCGPVEPDGPYPLRIWIHAGQRWEDSAYKATLRVVGATALGEWARRHPEFTPAGALLGTVRVTGCHHADECRTVSCEHGPEKRCFAPCGPPRWCSRWAEPDRWHWTLAEPQPLDHPISIRGGQRLWLLDDATCTSALNALKVAADG